MIYQALNARVLTGTFDRRSRSEVVLEVLVRTRPNKPRSASELGLSDELRKPLEDCWKTGRKLQPSVKNVLDSVKSAASTCYTVPSVVGAAQLREDTYLDLNDSGMSPPASSGDMEPVQFHRSTIP